MSNCNVTFYKDTDDNKGTGAHKNYDGPQSVADLSKVLWVGTTFDNDMKDDISWIDTSTQTWVRVYSKANFQGRTALIGPDQDRKSTRLNSSHVKISYAVFCLKKKKV